MSVKNDTTRRAQVTYLLVFLFGIAIIGKIIMLQYFENNDFEKTISKISQRDIVIEPNRGDICAEDGRLLASSIPYYKIHMDLKTVNQDTFNKYIDSLAYNLANLFIPENKNVKNKQAGYKSALINAKKKGSRYYLIKRKVSYTQLKKIKKFPIFNLGKYRGGLLVEEMNRREKPFGLLSRRTIGYLIENEEGEKVGHNGLERAYNHVLKGVRGVKLMQKIHGNNWMPISDDNAVEPQNGKNIITTIDLNIQDVAENALLKQLKKQNAQYGTAVLMEVKTGEIKAIANLKADTSGEYHESYNYAIGESTEPGSTFKLPVLMVALDQGCVKLTDTIDTKKGRVKYYDKTVKDSHHGGYGKITVKEALVYSSNVAMSIIVNEHYNSNPERFIDKLYSMNLNDKLDVEILGEGEPNIKYPGDKLWSGVSLVQMSYGYEVELTPLQILTFYNAVANNGRMVKPKFVKRIELNGEIIKTIKTEVINPSICSKATIKMAQEMLLDVVENKKGTAHNLHNNTYQIAGKTGTSQINYANRNQKMRYQASFAGYFPADNPKYSCIVVVDSPSEGVYYGNVVAGTVFKEIADIVYASSLDIHDAVGENKDNLLADAPYSKNGYKNELLTAFNHLGIKVENKDTKASWVLTQKQENSVKLLNRKVTDNLVPNVKGMGAKDAVFLLENSGLSVKLRGKGIVTEQSLNAGAKVGQNKRITIKLS